MALPISAYQGAAIIRPPDALRPVYISEAQGASRDVQERNTLTGLAIADASIPAQYRDGRLQIFEVPKTGERSSQYCARGYDLLQGESVPPSWSSDGWVQLPDNADVSCRKGFMKVIQYRESSAEPALIPYVPKDKIFARSWGDGTFLLKDKGIDFGATIVFRTIAPDHPYFIDGLKLCIESVWIQRAIEEIPRPFFRFSSTHPEDKCDGCIRSLSLYEALHKLFLRQPFSGMLLSEAADFFTEEFVQGLYREKTVSRNQGKICKAVACALSAAGQSRALRRTPLERFVNNEYFEPRVMRIVREFLDLT